jgi:hypothetical protein
LPDERGLPKLPAWMKKRSASGIFIPAIRMSVHKVRRDFQALHRLHDSYLRTGLARTRTGSG